jgi:hypothetical protein
MDRFPKNPEISNFRKIRPVSAEVVSREQTDEMADKHDEVNSSFS